MEIYEALKADHEEVKEFLRELVALKEDDDYRFVLIQEISSALIPHARAEEAVFYNTLRAVDADKALVRHGYREHMEAEALLRTLQVMDKLDLTWKPIAEKLQEAVLHHIEDEENEIFAEARQAFTPEEAVGMAQAFTELKGKVSQEGIVKNTMDMVVNLMPPRLADRIRNIGTGGEART